MDGGGWSELQGEVRGGRGGGFAGTHSAGGKGTLLKLPQSGPARQEQAWGFERKGAGRKKGTMFRAGVIKGLRCCVKPIGSHGFGAACAGRLLETVANSLSTTGLHEGGEDNGV